VRGSHGHLDRIGIDPAVQGQHLGEELLLHAIQRIAALGGRNVGLSTQRANARAQRLYQKYGFRATGDSLRLHGRILEPGARHRLAQPPP
jgi:ribosomal-protein-alanine N-acetyltransferase